MKPTRENLNIVFCHVDQIHHQALAAYGNPYVVTPHLDRMVAEGMSFRESYSANPICMPARTSWYTGRMSCETGVMVNSDPMVESLPDLGQWMSQRGYGCYYSGKWHVPRNVNKSFNVFPGGCGQGEAGDAEVARVAEAFFHNYKEQKPFFLNLGLLNPHDICYNGISAKYSAAKEGAEHRLDERLFPPLPPNFDPAVPPLNLGHKWLPLRVRLYLYYYYRMVEAVDAEVGRIYAALRESAFAENTVFIFSADHGEMMAEHNRYGKGVPYDAAARVPLIIVQPDGKSAGVRNTTHLVSGVDLTATILELTGLDPLPGMTMARSLVPLLRGDAPAKWRDYLAVETFQGTPATTIVTPDYKAMFNIQGDNYQLYDRRKDPWEMADLAGKPEHAATTKTLRGHLHDFYSRMVFSPDYLAGNYQTGKKVDGKRGGRKVEK